MAKGSVRKKGKKWYYRFYVEDESGKMVQREFAGTESKSETEALLRKAMEDYEAKKFVAKPENTTVGGGRTETRQFEQRYSDGVYGNSEQDKEISYRRQKAENGHCGTFTGIYGLSHFRRTKP